MEGSMVASDLASKDTLCPCVHVCSWESSVCAYVYVNISECVYIGGGRGCHHFQTWNPQSGEPHTSAGRGDSAELHFWGQGLRLSENLQSPNCLHLESFQRVP